MWFFYHNFLYIFPLLKDPGLLIQSFQLPSAGSQITVKTQDTNEEQCVPVIPSVKNLIEYGADGTYPGQNLLPHKNSNNLQKQLKKN